MPIDDDIFPSLLRAAFFGEGRLLLVTHIALSMMRSNTRAFQYTVESEYGRDKIEFQ